MASVIVSNNNDNTNNIDNNIPIPPPFADDTKFVNYVPKSVKCIVKCASINEYQQIIPKLFISNWAGASDKNKLKSHNITHILICANSLDPLYPDDYKYNKLELIDENDKLIDFFPNAFKFIYDAIHAQQGNNNNILIHCVHGFSRSASIIIGYCMYIYTHNSHLFPKHISVNNDNTYESILSHLKSLRSCVRPNYFYNKQLKEFQQLLNQGWKY